MTDRRLDITCKDCGEMYHPMPFEDKSCPRCVEPESTFPKTLFVVVWDDWRHEDLMAFDTREEAEKCVADWQSDADGGYYKNLRVVEYVPR